MFESGSSCSLRSLLREALMRWVGAAITGEVTVRLRRGNDYSILDTRGPRLGYHPDRLSMERTEDVAFEPGDRIGQLTMRNLDLADSRAKLEHYASLGRLDGALGDLLGHLEPGRATEITSTGEQTDPGEESLDRAAMEVGTD